MTSSRTSEEWQARLERVGREAVAPQVEAHARDSRFHRAAFAAVAQEGLFRLTLPKELGGLGGDLTTLGLAITALGVGSGDLGFCVSCVAHAVAVDVLARRGDRELHERWLSKLLDGTALAAVANAEPQAGTDVMGLRSRARKTAAGFVLTSRKRCITNVGEAELMLCSARLQDVPPARAINIFVVPRGAPGVVTRRIGDLSGLRTSPTGDLAVRRAALPAWSRLGEEGGGVAIFRRMFALERLLTGYLYLAAIKRCLLRAVEHAERREQFGRPIGRNQYVQEKVVRLKVAQELLEAHLHATANAYAQGREVSSSLSVIKTFAIEAALTGAEDLIRLLGASGLRGGEPAGRMLQDLLCLSILGGTVELQKMVIYNETVRLMLPGPAAAKDNGDSAITVRRVPLHALDSALQKQLTELTARVFPDESALHGRFYYDSAPSWVAVASKAGNVVGMRVVLERAVPLGDREVRVAGIGIAVDPAHQHQGVGKRLTAFVLEELSRDGQELVLAFLLSRASETLLTAHGFRRLRANISYAHAHSGQLITEAMPCYARALRSSALLDEVEARGTLHIGVGTW